MIHMQHVYTTLAHDYEIHKEGMSIGIFRIIIRKKEDKKYRYTIVYGGESVLTGDTNIGRRIEAMRFAKSVLFNYVRHGMK
jgi:hypothetical protein